jgi:hypothetical protein
MIRRMRVRLTALMMAGVLFSIAAAVPLRAQESNIERAGVITGVTAGNVIFVPLKAISFTMGALSGALSFVFTGGDLEVTRQVWGDTLHGPYVITPAMARKAIGERPELSGQ